MAQGTVGMLENTLVYLRAKEAETIPTENSSTYFLTIPEHPVSYLISLAWHDFQKPEKNIYWSATIEVT